MPYTWVAGKWESKSIPPAASAIAARIEPMSRLVYCILRAALEHLVAQLRFAPPADAGRDTSQTDLQRIGSFLPDEDRELSRAASKCMQQLASLNPPISAVRLHARSCHIHANPQHSSSLPRSSPRISPHTYISPSSLLTPLNPASEHSTHTSP